MYTVNGRIVLHEPPEQEKFENTGEGWGDAPLYAYGHAKDADHLKVLHDNVHLFAVDMKQKRDSLFLTKNNIGSLEIWISSQK